MNVDVSYGLFYFRTQYCTEVDVDLHHSEPIILFSDKADAISFLAAVDDKEQDIFLQHRPGKNVLVNHPASTR